MSKKSDLFPLDNSDNSRNKSEEEYLTELFENNFHRRSSFLSKNKERSPKSFASINSFSSERPVEQKQQQKSKLDNLSRQERQMLREVETKLGRPLNELELIDTIDYITNDPEKVVFWLEQYGNEAKTFANELTSDKTLENLENKPKPKLKTEKVKIDSDLINSNLQSDDIFKRSENKIDSRLLREETKNKKKLLENNNTVKL